MCETTFFEQLKEFVTEVERAEKHRSDINALCVEQRRTIKELVPRVLFLETENAELRAKLAEKQPEPEAHVKPCQYCGVLPIGRAKC